MPDYELSATSMAEADLCRAVGETLDQHYSGHPWRVGCDLEAGSIVIELGYPAPHVLGNATFGYLLHPQTLMGPGGQRRVMQAGGELLERYNLARSSATGDSVAAAAEHGLIIDDTDDAKRLARKRAN